MSEIMKIIDERETQKKKKNEDRKKQMSDASYSESVRAKWFCCAFKLGLVQLIYKASLIFNSNLELALSIVLNKRELYESKHVVLECRCLKICDLLSFLISSSILVLMTTSLANVARTTASTGKFVFQSYTWII